MTQQERWETYRFNKLLRSGFLEFEAKELKAIPLKVPYMKTLIAERARLYEPYRRAIQRWWRLPYQRARIQGQYEDAVKKLYKDKGWKRETITSGGRKRTKDDVWVMLRDERRKAIERGYDPKTKSPSQARRASHHKQNPTQEDLDIRREQRRQYRQEHKEDIRFSKRLHSGGQPAVIRGWIRDLDKEIAKTKSPARKAQLEEQKRNLQAGLGE